MDRGGPASQSVHGRAPGSRVRSTVLTALVGLVVAPVLGGYPAGWRRTGFTGNPLWNWLNLLLLPLLLPTVVAPALTALLLGRIVYLDEHGRPVKRPEGPAATSGAA